MGCVSRDPHPRKSVQRQEEKMGIKEHRQILQGDVAPKKNRERKGPSRGITQKPKFEERSQEVTLQQERCARRAAWDSKRNIYKLKNADKATLYSRIEARATPAPTSKSQEARRIHG